MQPKSSAARQVFISVLTCLEVGRGACSVVTASVQQGVSTQPQSQSDGGVRAIYFRVIYLLWSRGDGIVRVSVKTETHL